MFDRILNKLLDANPFRPNVPLIPLKTLEIIWFSLWFSDVFREIKRENWEEND